jgi:hypothetical protein
MFFAVNQLSVLIQSMFFWPLVPNYASYAIKKNSQNNFDITKFVLWIFMTSKAQGLGF